MDDLLATFAEARYGVKQAAEELETPEVPAEPEAAKPGAMQRFGQYFSMPQLTPEVRDIRSALERSTKLEGQRRGEAQEAVDYAKALAGRSNMRGLGGKLWDTAKANIPGFSTLNSQPGEEHLGLTDPASHLAASGIGGAVGAGIQSGLLPGRRTATIADSLLRAVKPTDMKTEAAPIMKIVAGATGAKAEHLRELGQTNVAKLMTGSGEGAIRNRLPGSTAAQKLEAMVGDADTTKKILGKFRELGRRGTLSRLAHGGRRSDLETQIMNIGGKPGWRTGAGIGALAAGAPFAMANFLRNRQMRALGGHKSLEAYEAAKELLQQSERQRQWRGAQLGQFDHAGGDPSKFKMVGFDPFRDSSKIDVGRAMERMGIPT